MEKVRRDEMRVGVIGRMEAVVMARAGEAEGGGGEVVVVVVKMRPAA